MFKTASATGLMLAFAASPALGNFIVNGDFESPVGAEWNLVGGLAGGSATVTTVADVSGVEDTQALFLNDNSPDGGSAGVPRASQAFISQSGTIELSFDYTFDAVGGFPLRVQLFEGGVAGTEVFRLDVNTGRVGFFAAGLFVQVADLNADANSTFDDWYNITTTIDLAAGTATGTVTNLSDGTDLTIGGFDTGLNILGGPGLSVDAIQIIDFQVVTGNGTNAIQSATYFDNFVLVPEPATAALVALGGLCVLARARRS